MPTYSSVEPAVHAAAISSRADILLTNNDPHDITKDPDGEPYEIYTADDFFMLVADSNPACVLTVTQKQFDYWKEKRGSRPIEEALRNAGCVKFADRIRASLQQIALM